MHVGSGRNVVGRLFCLSALGLVVCGCTPTGGGGTDNTNGGGTDAGTLSVDFGSASGGSVAVAEDSKGNQYSFRSKEVGGETLITEANVQLANGTTVKCSLDDQGRPVKLRASNNENADISYSGDTARVRYTTESGETSDVGGIDATSAKAAVQARRIVNHDKRMVFMQGSESSNLRDLRQGLETFEEIIESIFGDDSNPAAGTSLEDAARLVAEIVSQFDIDETEDELGDIELDDVPETIMRLAGQTFILFDAEGACVQEAELENELTFDSFGILLTERDRNFVFPDFSFGGANRGFTINYESGTPVDLTGGEDLDFTATVTPVFTGTQLDSNGNITIERRFLAELTFEVDLFTETEATAEQLFNAALINGSLNDDGSVLEFDLVFVDLKEDTPVDQFGRVRYYRQGTLRPEDRQFDCDLQVGRDAQGELDCPGEAMVGAPFNVTLRDGPDPEFEDVQYDWYIADGFGFVDGPEFGTAATIIPTDDGILEINLLVSDFRADQEVFDLYVCEVRVGQVRFDDNIIDCLEFWTTGEPGTLFVNEAVLDDSIAFVEWSVHGPEDFEVLDEHDGGIELIFYDPGFYEVRVELVRTDGTFEIGICGVDARPGGDPDFDICEAEGWYGDGFCDDFCLFLDPDCEGTLCDPHDLPGDGFCDLHCDLFDPDCFEVHLCDPNDFPGDGQCDEFCDLFDPDCENVEHLCDPFDFPGDGYCDDFCDIFDPDCEFDNLCKLDDFPDDGFCDQFCDLFDPDCEMDEQPLCLLGDFPGDGFCDDLCDLPDPDCDFVGEPLCDPSDFVNDGVCDAFCELIDSDCDGVFLGNDAVTCLELMTADQAGIFFLSGSAPVAEVTDRLQWNVFGTDAFELFGGESADITFFEAGDFRVQLTVFLLDGTVEISTCEVSVSVSTTP